MRDGIAVRRRSCPACATEVSARSARWCGSCGALLVEPPEDLDGDADREGGSGRWRLVTRVVAVAAAVALVVLAGDAVVERVSPATTTLADRAVEAPDADALERVTRRPPVRPPARTDPVCRGVRDLDCFTWTVRTGDVAAIVAAGDLVVASEWDTNTVTARSAVDGRTLWTASGGPSDQSGNLVVVDDLVLHQAARDRTVGLALATGEERWSTSALAEMHLYDGRMLDDTVVVMGERGSPSIDGHHPQRLTALDAATGEVRWQLEGASASLGAGGVAVIMDEDGHVVVSEPSGGVLWEHDIEIDREHGGGAHAAGHVVTVFDATGDARLLRLRDGADLGAVDGYTLATDATHTLLRAQTAHAPDAPGGTYLMLVDADGEVWRVPFEETDRMCFPRARLEPRTVEIDLCGDAIVLDRATGEERSSVVGDPPAAAAPADDGFALPIGDLLLVLADPDDWDGDVLLIDGDGDEVARLPRETWPVTSRDGEDWGIDLGGVAVLHGPGWLLGVPVPERATTDTRGPAGRAARGGTGALAG